FTLYEKLVTIAGGLPIPIEFEPDSGLLPLGEILARAGEDAVVIVCSPNNPTGGVLPEGGLQKLIDTGAMVLFDRAYGDFAIDTFRAERNSKEIFEALFARGILVRDVSAYPRLANCLRISIGSPEQNGRMLEALKESV